MQRVEYVLKIKSLSPVFNKINTLSSLSPKRYIIRIVNKLNNTIQIIIKQRIKYLWTIW